MDPKGIGFFKAILESYEEVAVMTVLDGKRGEMEVIYPACQEEVLTAIMADMKRFGIQFQGLASPPTRLAGALPSEPAQPPPQCSLPTARVPDSLDSHDNAGSAGDQGPGESTYGGG